MMRSATMLNLPRRFWQIAAATLAWWALSGGALSLMVGIFKGGIANTVIGVGALTVALSHRALGWLEGRRVHRHLVWLMLIWYAFLPIMLLGFITTTPSTMGFQLPYMVVREIVLVALVALVIRESMISMRPRG